MKLGFLITARLKSTRFPLKILKDLNGKTVIERVIERTKAIPGVSEVVLCTSTNPQDRILVDLAVKNGIYYFTGDESDVLKRLMDAATFFRMDAFLSITADNPLFSIYHANLVTDKLKMTQCDYVKINGLPIGTAVYGVKTKALQVVCQIKNVLDTEIWGPFFNQPEIFSVGSIEISEVDLPQEIRLTLDYPEDYRLINHLYHHFSATPILNLDDVFEYLREHPDIASINRNCIQLNLSPDLIEKINRYFAENKKNILQLKQSVYETNA